jgi:tetratricopeptide (TPR) repeat protein
MVIEPADSFQGTSRFAVVRRLGAGGMGVVYEVHDRERDVRVALKLLPRVNAVALFRFKQEFRTVGALVHPNLVSLYELISDGAQWFFTMELVTGSDLLHYLRPGETGALDRGLAIDPEIRWAHFEQVRRTFRQLAEGVNAFHATGCVHRDLKPSNVLVRPDGRVTILDFGLVLGPEAGRGLAEQVGGTIAYMAPEQWAGELVTPASDWYAVGVMLYEALTGQPPFPGTPTQLLVGKLQDAPAPPVASTPDIPDDLNAVCVELLRRDPSRRLCGADLLERLGSHSPTPIPTGGYATGTRAIPLVGREPHLAALHEAFQALTQTGSVAVSVHGASGAGKSVLVQRFLGDLTRTTDIVLLTGRCYEQESVPYKALDSLVDDLTRYLARLPRLEVEQVLPRHIAALARIFPALLQVEAIREAPPLELEMLDPQEFRRRAFVSLSELLARIGDRHRLVLYIDDLHWGDVDSAALLAELLYAPDAPRLLLIVCYRREYADSSPCLKALREGAARHPSPLWRGVPVDPLPAEAARDLARALLPGDPLAAAHVARIAAQAQGSPFFIYELSHHLRSRASSGEEVRGADDVDLDGLIWDRVEQLTPDARRFLEIVAVAGRPLQAGSAYAAADLHQYTADPFLLLRAAHFVRSTGPRLEDEIETYHDRVREAITSRLDPAALIDRHRRLALTFEATGHTDPETIASHFEQAGEAERAGAHYVRAADAAARALAFDRAARLYRAALRLRSDSAESMSPLQVRLGDALANAGRGYEAAQAYRQAGATQGGDTRLELRRLAATQFCVSGHVDEGRAIFRDLMRELGLRMPSHTVEILASLLWRRAWLGLRGLRFRPRQPAEVRRLDLLRLDLLWSVSAGLSGFDVVGVASLQTQGLLLALRTGEPRRLTQSLAWEAVLTGARGWRAAERCVALLEAAGQLAARADDPHAAGMLRLAAGWVAFFQLRLRDALRYSEEAERIFRDQCTGVWWELDMTRTMAAWSLVHCGEISELTRRGPIYLSDARARGDLFAATNLAAVVLPQLRLAGGDPDTAERDVEEAQALWPYKGFHIQHVAVLFTQVNISLYRGAGLAAWERITDRWPALRRSLQLQNQMARITMLDLRARSAIAAAAAGRDPDGLLGRAERDARRIRGERVRWGDAFADRIVAGIAEVRGRPDLAAPRLEAAMGVLDELGLRLHAAATRRRLGQLLGGQRGRELIQAAETAMQAQKIRDPGAITRMYTTGSGG